MTSKNNTSDKYLIILDINGLLCRKVIKPNLDSDDKIKSQYDDIKSQYETFELHKYIVFIRPEARKFLRKCYKSYNVGFFSSTTKYNADPILKQILTKKQYKNAIFKWYRDKTKNDTETSEFATVKNLEDIFSSDEISGFGLHNTIICDDEMKKLRHNPEQNCITFQSFEPLIIKKEDENNNNEKENSLDHLFEMIKAKLGNLEISIGINKIANNDQIIDDVNPCSSKIMESIQKSSDDLNDNTQL